MGSRAAECIYNTRAELIYKQHRPRSATIILLMLLLHLLCSRYVHYPIEERKGQMKRIEKRIEQFMYFSRWLLSPIYLGLSIGLLMLGIAFFKEVFHTLPHILSLSESDLVLLVLSLIDLSLVGGLVVMVMISGYENFVSQLDIAEGEEKLSWLGTMDASSLKMKVAASIVAISSIHLLRVFMNAQKIPNDKIMWYIILHMTFVASAFIMGFLDKKTQEKH